ncbi:hypothetical protein PFICI_01996 [Pestalotiopsis fici W106-1]|uniref:Uncharacterized protein n=1 Tax=Pestalotiopsis fici (strain W106-1 / CGMCC3.15140) TaxID=1229662 RepID=W3XQ41_PESFW|nr:uncharacterized protein PFICI_01996 [Pestalotiopsis fici W106-1]ETS88168.1 hypothetical protein PFICI_01996 [Pestalotiopsis fici W106-1]
MADQGQALGPAADVTPPWGAFPAEQYLIRHWDFSSTASAGDQRRDLIRAFTQLDAFPEEWDATGRKRRATTVARIPTEREVREVLSPWRPLRWRDAALHLWRNRNDEEVWLRTHYDEDSDAKFSEWRETDEDYDPAFEEDCREWTILDDPDLFNRDWSTVFEVLPELLGPVYDYDPYSNRHLGRPDKLQELRENLRNSADHLTPDEVEAGRAGQDLQSNVVASFLIVADLEAFETDKLRLLFLDARGNIVRESRLPCTETWEMRDAWNARKFRDSNFWNDRHRSNPYANRDPGSELGEKYTISGEIGRVLYALD